jgi:hypothetical protein
MALPGFTAGLAAYRSRQTYRPLATGPAQPPGLTPQYDFCAGRELDANYPHPETCEKYISCDLSGRAQEMPCVAGLHFMADETRWGHCDYPHIANCELDH